MLFQKKNSFDFGFQSIDACIKNCFFILLLIGVKAVESLNTRKFTVKSSLAKCFLQLKSFVRLMLPQKVKVSSLFCQFSSYWTTSHVWAWPRFSFGNFKSENAEMRRFRKVQNLEKHTFLVFSCEICEICKNTAFFEEHLQTAASENEIL